MHKENYFQINSVVKTFKLIEMLLRKKEFDLADLSRSVSLPKTTVHRILLTLQSIGYVEQRRENSRYSASMKFFEIGCQVIRHLSYPDTAYPFMVELAEATKETISFSVLNGNEMIVILKIDSKHQLKQDTALGDRFLPHCTGVGKAVLAFMDKKEASKILEKTDFNSGTLNACKTFPLLKQELKKTVERGYAVDDEEFALGVRCIGAPVFDHNNEVVAGISLSAPTSRLTYEKISPYAELVTQTAKKISKKIGASGD